MRLLLVEDNETLAEALTRGLTAEGFTVDLETNGTDGLWRAQEYPYDALILDIMLPGTNGYEICRTLREQGFEVPILMLTAKDGEFDEAEGLDLGADDYLRKPFSFVVLVARIRSMLRRGGDGLRGDTWEFHGLQVDVRTHQVTFNGSEVELTPREFSLLEVLMNPVDEPHSRAELLDRVWGDDLDVKTNVVEVYVGYLRKKLAAATDGAIAIDTIRGVGYRLGTPDDA